MSAPAGKDLCSLSQSLRRRRDADALAAARDPQIDKVVGVTLTDVCGAAHSRLDKDGGDLAVDGIDCRCSLAEIAKRTQRLAPVVGNVTAAALIAYFGAL
jgi:hypothetical protein